MSDMPDSRSRDDSGHNLVWASYTLARITSSLGESPQMPREVTREVGGQVQIAKDMGWGGRGWKAQRRDSQKLS